MTTHSTRSADREVWFRSERTFTLWRYGVGHSQLLLRSVPDGTDTTCLDLLFEGVRAVQLVTRYETMEIRPTGEEEARQILELVKMDDRWREKHLVVSLRSRSGSGFVVCRKIIAVDSGADPAQPDGETGEPITVWTT